MTISKDALVYGFVGILISAALFWNGYEKHYQNAFVYPDASSFREREIGSVNADVKDLRREFDEIKTKADLMVKSDATTSGRMDVIAEYFRKYSPENFEKDMRATLYKIEQLEEKTLIPNLVKEVGNGLEGEFTPKYEAANLKRRIDSLETDVRELRLKLSTLAKDNPEAQPGLNPRNEFGP